MNFIDEVRMLSETCKSEKFEKVKELIKIAASEGKKLTVIQEKFYDVWIIKWLKSQGFDVHETLDQRGGDFMTVSWNITNP